MRQAFMIGAIVLWVAINIVGSICDMATPLSQTEQGSNLTQAGTLNAMKEVSASDSAFITVFTKLGDYFEIAGRVFSLNHESLWQGDAQYIYYFLILPIGISFWVVFLLSIRGVGSS